MKRLGCQPQTGETCIDLGASPGGWTWVLANLGAQVISVDKAPLAPAIAIRPNVQPVIESAFAIRPTDYPDATWILSDIICYPERLLRLAERWLSQKPDANYLFTIKFQAPTNFEIINKFKEIEGSHLIHLHHNKHELTWLRPAPK